ncbi:hypothetical protein [Paenibacillus sp. FSL H3-0469]|uniref:hypothetical protein n=1 Tax=Paenibacillus sp. FSL H3-0469 TaxID=2954506 RepID=UPI0031019F11
MDIALVGDTILYVSYTSWKESIEKGKVVRKDSKGVHVKTPEGYEVVVQERDVYKVIKRK